MQALYQAELRPVFYSIIIIFLSVQEVFRLLVLLRMFRFCQSSGNKTILFFYITAVKKMQAKIYHLSQSKKITLDKYIYRVYVLYIPTTGISQLKEKISMSKCNNPNCKCENCQCGDNCQCGKECRCGENCTCGKDCKCTKEKKCNPKCKCGKK